MVRRSQEKASRAEGWREGTALASSLEHRLHQPRLPWSHPENPPLGWCLAVRAIPTQLRLLLTWSDLDSVICNWERCASHSLRCARKLARHLPLCISLNPRGIQRSERISFPFDRGSERRENWPVFLWPLRSQMISTLSTSPEGLSESPLSIILQFHHVANAGRPEGNGSHSGDTPQSICHLNRNQISFQTLTINFFLELLTVSQEINKKNFNVLFLKIGWGRLRKSASRGCYQVREKSFGTKELSRFLLQLH